MACTHPPAYLYDVNHQTHVCAFCALEDLQKQLGVVRQQLETPGGPNTFLWIKDLAQQRMQELESLRLENSRLKKAIGVALEQLGHA